MKISLVMLFLVLTASVSAADRPIVFFDSEGEGAESESPRVERSIESQRGNSTRPELNRANLLEAARSGPSVGSVKFGLDVGGEEVSSVQFTISPGRAGADSIDLSRCDAYLPDTHVGGCKIKGDKILFYAFSPVNAKLETGFLGELTFNRRVNAAALKISEEIMGDTQGSELKN